MATDQDKELKELRLKLAQISQFCEQQQGQAESILSSESGVSRGEWAYALALNDVATHVLGIIGPKPNFFIRLLKLMGVKI